MIDVDDTDGLDPTAEFESWRARELTRLLRDKQAQAAKDEEQAEIERRRAMPEEQRLREDMEFAEASRNREKGEMGFMQKYYHKGAFHTVCRSHCGLIVSSRSWAEDLRTTTFYNEIIPVLPSLLWMFRCYQKLCKSEISEK